MGRLSSVPRRRRLSALLAAVATAATTGSMLVGPTASGQEATPPPNTFSIRLEGYAVEANTFSTATAVTPRTAYSFAKLNSVLDLDGGRGLDMEARGANDQYAGLEGAVIFAGDTPTDGNNLPGYTQAFFPTFEGFSTVSEKCVSNQAEAREAPECRDQDGPYALARVVPDQAAPLVEGIGRNQGSDDGGGDARSRSVISPQPDGAVRGEQSNRGTDQTVPGTPITVESYVAEQTVVATVGEAAVEVRCAGQVSVGGQPVTNNEQLQQALAPLTVASDLKVAFEPASEPVINEQAGGTLEASCRGPRFTVLTAAQGGTGTTYTFGRTFAAVGVTENAELGFGGGDVAGGFTSPPATPDSFDAGGAEAPTTGSTDATTPEAPASDGAPEPVPDSGPAMEEVSSPDLIRRSIDAVPIGLLTAAAAGLLPLAIWMLLGVTG